VPRCSACCFARLQAAKSTSKSVSTLRLVDTAATAALVTADGRDLAGSPVVDATGARIEAEAACRPPRSRGRWPSALLGLSLGWRGRRLRPHALLQRYHKASVMIGVPADRPAASRCGTNGAFFWSLKRARGGWVRAAGLAAWKDHVAGLWPECQAYLAQIEKTSTNWALARYGHHTLTQPVGRGLAIVGDAAHSNQSALGQGANMAARRPRLAHALAINPDRRGSAASLSRMRRTHMRCSRRCHSPSRPSIIIGIARAAVIRDRVVAVATRFRRAQLLRRWWRAQWWIRSRRLLEEADWS